MTFKHQKSINSINPSVFKQLHALLIKNITLKKNSNATSRADVISMVLQFSYLHVLYLLLRNTYEYVLIIINRSYRCSRLILIYDFSYILNHN
uniref:Uncharacterized protein n=1 Tax=Heterorhabditis bacteriophora TaxID=37862 RepID=A0A1I7WQQ6_HETBA